MKRSRLRLIAPAVLCCVLAAGCGDDQPQSSQEPGSAESSGTTSAAASSAPTSSTSATAPSTDEPTTGGASVTATSTDDAASSHVASTTQGASADDSLPSRAGRSLVPRADMPTPGSLTWRKDAGTVVVGRRSSSVCSLTSLTSIGGVRERTRTYATRTPTTWVRQTSVVFPDARTARRSASVLDTWFARCSETAAKLGLHDVTSRSGPTVQTLTGPASTVLSSFRSRARGRVVHVDEGWTRDGDTLSYVVAQSRTSLGSGRYVARLLRAAGTRLVDTR